MIYTFESLSKAIFNNRPEQVREILEAVPALAEQTDISGCPVPHIAAKQGNPDILKYITEYSRASLNSLDAHRRNVLHYGVLSGRTDLVKYLVERCGMDPLEGDSDLVTPYELSYGLPDHSVYNYLKETIGCEFQDMYANPVRKGFFPDPSVVRVGTDYYMVNSSFIFFPCIPISHSKDLINWEIIGHAVTNPDWAQLDGLEGGRGYWAPDISYDNGMFYITATYRLNDDGMPYRRQMITCSERPEGPYRKPVFLDEDGIDPSLFHEDGRHYMLLNRGARLMELNESCTAIISEPELLFYGDMKRAPEGAHLLKKDGWYYLFEAEGGTGPGHRETVSRSRDLHGPYKPCPYNPILREEDTAAPLTRCGHGKPVNTPDGRWFMTYLCARRYNGQYTFLGRETALDEITWTPDGWPLVGRNSRPSHLAPKPFPSLAADTGCSRHDTQTGPFSEYFTPRSHEPGAISISDGAVSLLSSPAPLSSPAARNLFLRRQTSFCFTFRVEPVLSTIPSSSEAGITCYYDENSFLAFRMYKDKDNKLYACITEHAGTEDISDLCKPLPVTSADSVSLTVSTDGLRRNCRIYHGQNIVFEHTCENVSYLSDEGVKLGKRFTGACVGVYARGPVPFFAEFKTPVYSDCQ